MFEMFQKQDGHLPKLCILSNTEPDKKLSIKSPRLDQSSRTNQQQSFNCENKRPDPHVPGSSAPPEIQFNQNIWTHSSDTNGIFDQNQNKYRNGANSIALQNLPPVVCNSALVRQKVSAKNSLAAATVTTGASLPLMIGGRSRCVLNLVVSDTESTKSASKLQVAATQGSDYNNEQIDSQLNSSLNGPQNTALRAEQRSRRQNMISVVRPVINHSPVCQVNGSSSNMTIDGLLPRERTKLNGRLEDSEIWAEQVKGEKETVSLIDELMNLDKRLNLSSDRSNLFEIDDLILGKSHHEQSVDRISQLVPSEMQFRQQMALYRREQHELNRNISRQHRFIVSKIEERKRNLQIIQSVWIHKDFKYAIEKLVDIYHQGLVFSPNDNSSLGDQYERLYQKSNISSTKDNCAQQLPRGSSSQLTSSNSSLVVDVVSVIILRPRLWTLEICQLLLPIIINDLLAQKSKTYEHYIDVAIKTIRLILTHFSSVIKTTLQAQKDNARLNIGVDLSREDRINKCSICHRYLMEARSMIGKRLSGCNSKNGDRCGQDSGINGKLASIYRELEQFFNSDGS